MFSKLTDFGMTRTGGQALGFYIAYLALVIIGAAVVGGIGGLVAGEDNGAFGNGVRLGTLVSIVISVGLALLILKAKKKTNQFSWVLLAVASGLLALIGGGVLGLIIPAVFTTKGKKGKK